MSKTRSSFNCSNGFIRIRSTKLYLYTVQTKIHRLYNFFYEGDTLITFIYK